MLKRKFDSEAFWVWDVVGHGSCVWDQLCSSFGPGAIGLRARKQVGDCSAHRAARSLRDWWAETVRVGTAFGGGTWKT